MDDWSPEQRAEWQTRFSAAPAGSQERALLEDMQWTGIYIPTGEALSPRPPMDDFYSAEPVFQSNVGVAPPSAPAYVPPPPPSTDDDDGLYGPAPVAPAPPPPPPPAPEPLVPMPGANVGFKLPAPVTAQVDGQLSRIAMVPVGTPPGHPSGIPVAPPAPPTNVSAGIAMARSRRNVNIGGARRTTMRSGKGGKIVAIFFNIRDQVKLYHWQTKSFAEHKATDDLVGKLDTSIDTFVEAYMGRYGRPRLNQTYPLKNLTVSGIRSFIARSDDWLTYKLPRMVKKTDTDLLNIRDEILADLNQIKYLFTLS